MYAIIRSGGKQAKVREGDVIDVERLRGDGEVTFSPLLIVGEDGDVVSGRADLEGATVFAEIVGASSGPKIDIFKYKNKTGYRRRAGHRQKYTTIKINKIELGKSAKKAKPKPKTSKEEAPAASEEE